MKRWIFLLSLLVFSGPLAASAQNNGVSVGYGFSFLTPSQEMGEVKGDRKYNFEHFTYFHQWSLFRNGYLVLEPFMAYVNQPESGLEFGLSFLLRYFIKTSERTSLFGNLGVGGAHTTIRFEEQGTKNFFVLSAGIGFKWGNFFIENRFRHYSNAHLATPNDSVNGNIIMIGMYF